MRLTLALAAAGLIAIVSAAAALPASDRAPAPLRGTPLAGSRLRLVVADNPPFVLDVDSGVATPVAGLRSLPPGIVWTVGVGGRAAAVVAEGSGVFGVTNEVRVAALGAGTDAVPGADGESVWVKSRSESGCALRRMRVDGEQVRPPTAFPCSATIAPGGALGVVVNRTRVLEPRSGRTVLRTRWGVVAAAGTTFVLAGPGRRLTVLDARTGRRRTLAWPSVLGNLDAPASDPRGRFIALGFANPAWAGGSAQAADVWVLDTRSGRLTQVAGMPAFVSLKATSMAWTADGRLVFLGESGRIEVVAVWRPGAKNLAVKTVRLPERSDSGSDAFAVLG